MQEFIREYIEKLEDDLNTPEALAVFHSFLKFVNT
jgi:cysteinyl-tRNA synthetase